MPETTLSESCSRDSAGAPGDLTPSDRGSGRGRRGRSRAVFGLKPRKREQGFLELSFAEDCDPGISQHCRGDAAPRNATPGERPVVHIARAAGRTAVLEHGEANAPRSGHDERVARTLDERVGDVPSCRVDDPRFSLRHRGSAPFARDLDRAPRRGQASGDFRTYGYDSTLRCPLKQGAMIALGARAVVTHGMAQKTRADQDRTPRLAASVG